MSASLAAPVVLVVEDNPVTRKLYRIELQQAGFEVVEAADGAAALAAVDRRAPAAVVLDIGLPDIDGFDLVRRVRSRAALAEIPIVACSAGIARLDPSDVRALGFDDFLLKPIAGEALAASLNARLGRASTPAAGAEDQDRLGARHAERAVVAMLIAVAETLAATDNVAQALPTLLPLCLDAAGISAGALYVVDPGGRLDLIADCGFDVAVRPGVQDLFGHPELLRDAAAAREPQAIPVHRGAPGASFVQEIGAASILLVPLVAGPARAGVLMLVSESEDLSASRWNAFARTLSVQLGLMIRLLCGERTAAAVADVARTLARSLDLFAVGQRVVSPVPALFGVRGCVLWKALPDGGLALVDSATDTGPLFPPDTVLPPVAGVSGRALAEGRPLRVDDILAEPHEVSDDFRRLLTAAGCRTIFSLPLQVRDQRIGVLWLVDVLGRRFSPAEMDLFQLFADQVAMALHNAALFEQVDRRRRSAEMVAEVARTLAEGWEPTRAAARIVDTVATLLGTHAAALYWRETGSGDVGLLSATRGTDGDFNWPERLGPCYGLTTVALREGAPVQSPDVRVDPRVTYPSGRVPPTARDHGARLSIPLTAHGQTLGALTVVDRTGRRFTEEEIGLVAVLADHAALALANAEVHRSAVERGNQLDALLAASRSVMTGLELDDVLARIVDEAARITGAADVVILLLDREAGVLRPGAARGARLPAGFEVPLGEGFSGTVARTGEPLVVPDTWADPRNRLIERDRQLGLRTFLGLPIQASGEVLGVLTVCTRESRVYAPAELDYLGSFADQAALAIRHAQLYAREAAARAAAEESEARYRGLFDGVPVGLVRAATDGTILAANPAAVEILGYPDLAALRRVRASELYADPNDRKRWLDTLERDGVVRDATMEMCRADGSRAWVRRSLRALRDAAGSLVGYEGSLEDVTVLRQTEEQVRQLQKMEAIGRLAGGIAHDFNNLLTVIIGRAQVLGRRLESQPALVAQARLVEETGQRAAALTRQLLAFSRRQVLQPRVLKPNDLIGGMEAMLRRLIGEDVELTTSLAPDAGQVQADPSQIEQVVMNLVVNARDAVEPGGHIVIRTANADIDELAARRRPGLSAGRYVAIEVRDDGRGIDAATQARIFEPFFTTKPEGKGTGLGLSTVLGIVQQSDGHVTVCSEPGRGSTFTIYLPRTDAAPAAGAPEVDPEPRGSETILLVEDDPGLRDLTRELLESRGYRVLEATDAADAERLATEDPRPIHLLLTDVVMPKVGGPALAERVLEHRPGLRVLFMSGYTDETVIRHGLTTGRVALLEKPFTAAQLAARVRTVLDTAPAPAAMGEHAARTRTVLLIEDDPSLQRAAAVSLRMRGLTVVAAGDGEEGLRLAREARPDLVLLDLLLPKLGGLEVLRALRAAEATRAIPVLVLSNAPGDPKELEDLGVSACLVKAHVSLRQLGERVLELLDAPPAAPAPADPPLQGVMS